MASTTSTEDTVNSPLVGAGITILSIIVMLIVKYFVTGRQVRNLRTHISKLDDKQRERYVGYGRYVNSLVKTLSNSGNANSINGGNLSPSRRMMIAKLLNKNPHRAMSEEAHSKDDFDLIGKTRIENRI